MPRLLSPTPPNRRTSPSRRTRPGVLVGALVTAAALTTPALTAQATAAPASAPTITYQPVPDPRIPQYDVKGQFPVITGAPAEEQAVRHAFAKYEAAYKKSALADEKAAPSSYRGFFGVSGATTVANATYVSTVEAMCTLYPGGNDCANAFSVTALANGTPVSIASLFTRDGGVALLAIKSRAQVFARYPCVKKAEYDPDLGSAFSTAWKPDPRTFSHFALTPKGVLVDFEQGEFAEEACGQQHSLISWQALRPALSPLGKRLAAAATPSTSVGRIS